MKALTFTLINDPEERLDLSLLNPVSLGRLTNLEIAKLRVGTSRRPALMGDIFKISGKDRENLVIDGGSSRFDGLGSGLTTGTIRIAGDVGDQAGRRLAGGSLIVEGSVGTRAGSGMRGGRIEISRNAGDGLAGPMPGETMGMEGGVLIVRGKAGHYAGDRMRRGVVAILGGCGDYAGRRMIAGSIVVTGRVGAMPGYLMKRGSLFLDRHPETLSPTFVDCGTMEIPFSAVFDRYLVEENILDRPLLGPKPGKYGGDNAVSGKGEILFRRRG